MQKRVIISITIILALLIFLTGCTMPDTSFISSFFSQGKISIGSGFKLQATHYPKGDIQQKIPFIIELTATNYRTSPVDGILCVVDTPSESYGGIPQGDESCKTIHLDSAEEFSGGEKGASAGRFVFPNEEGGGYFYKNIPPGQSQASDISATLMYPVNEKITAPICMRSSNVEEKSGCNDEESLAVSQEDYPLKVTKIDKVASPLRNKVLLSLDIHIQKAEKGEVVQKDSIYNENPSLTPTVEFSIGLQDRPAVFNCMPLKDNKFEFNENEKVIKCTSTIDITQDYPQDNLVIDLSYGFRQRLPITSVTIISPQAELLA